MGKQLLILSSELVIYILLGLFMGRLLDYHFDLRGWGVLAGVALVYLLWFLKFYKKLKKNSPKEK